MFNDRAHRVVHECELEQRGFAHDVREARPARFRAAHRVDEAHRLREPGVIERGRGVLVADRAELDAVVLSPVGHIGRRGVRHLERELTQPRFDRGERFLVGVQLGLHRSRGFDLRLPLVGRGLADLVRRLVLLRSLRLRRLAQHGLRVERGQDVVDEAGTHALALDAAPVTPARPAIV